MTNPSEFLSIAGSIAAALIAATIAYTVAVLSKDQKTSEFRQAWIDGLRADIAEFVAHATIISFESTARRTHETDPEELRKFLYEKHDNFIKLYTCHRRILLRLNTKKHTVLINAVDDLANLQPMKTQNQEISDNSDRVISESQIVLKSEWERVKRGESVFLWTKRVALSAMILAVILVIIFSTGHVSIAFLP